MNKEFIKVEDLTYYYNCEKKQALHNININIKKGEFLLVLGESGSGKSTLGRCICGIIPEFYGGKIKGNIYLNNKSMRETKLRDLNGKITMVFQNPESQIMMNKVHREIAFGLENLGVDHNCIKRRVMEVMQFVNILPLRDKNVDELSGGEKQKVNIASSLAYRPDCIILDEPTSQLDPTSFEEVVNLIEKINKELGITIIVIEQRVDKWFDKVDNIAFMHRGEIKFKGNIERFVKFSEGIDFLPSYIRALKQLNFDLKYNFKKDRENLEKLLEKNEVQSKNQKLTDFKDDIIKIKNLKFNYNHDKSLGIKDISLSIKMGQSLALIGANGSGKSTFLKALSGILNYKGSIKVLNKEIKKYNRYELSSLIGFVSQNPYDYISKDTVYDEIKFTLDNFNIKEYSKIDKILEKLQIQHLKDKNPRDLSGGEIQRVAIASILVLKSKIILLDEPTKGLDNKAKDNLKNVLKQLQIEDITIIIVTHDIEFAANICNEFMIMFNGEIVLKSSKEEALSEGVYYNTDINKLFKNVDNTLFTVEDVIERYKG